MCKLNVMKIISKIGLFLGVCGWALAMASGATSGAAASETKVSAAIRAIQQAPDPSAVVAAFANGYALDRNNPKLYEAYVGR